MASLSRRTRFRYSLGSFVTGGFGTVPGLLLLPYLTDTMAVPAAAAGIIVFVPKAWDVVFNPVAGRLSDADLARTGSRRRFLLRGGIGVAILFFALFAHPGFGTPLWDATYVVVMFFLCATAYAFFQVPFNALPAELTDSAEERTKLTSVRIGVLAVAVLVSGGGAPAITDLLPGVAGYRVMGLVMAVIILAATLGVYFGLKGAPVGSLRPNTVRLKELARTIAQWRSFRWLLGVYFIQALGIGTVLAAIPYFAQHVLGDPSYRTYLFVGFVGPALVTMPLWPRLGARWGKLAGFRIATASFFLGLVAMYFADRLPFAATLVFVALAGVGYAGISVFPLAILPDLISAEEERTGETRAGVTAGVWTASETLGLALGPGLFGLVLQGGSYVSSTGATAVPQPPSAITAIVLGASVLPAVLIALGIPLLRRSVLEKQA
ncbi:MULTISPECIES: MFS transporter [Amycolatopsis]|uniref:MFS transporter n=1 Tax=Amycolatopsis dendrobii TaxID=2760662 RepID=A0A7W3VRM9_9PSEU|nr:MULTISPECIES: MFS transporter [Amycolatopsis]MBB1151805.1 MFS transporter [Amycolatopsis dendrobii]UKD57986.1 MFS transporter [Amycolatopsis sp. FU40]